MSNEPKWTLIFDAGKCNGCNNCTIATRDEYVGNVFPGYAEEMPLHGHHWIDLRSRERGQPPIVDVTYYPVMCQHCEDPACAKVGPAGAVRKRADGVVIIEPVASKGARDIVDACPFGAIWWNEEKQIPQHWNFDAHLLDAGWTGPRCTQACPTGALTATRLLDDDYERLLRSGEVAPLAPEHESRPRVLYKGIEPVKSEFVSGTLVKRSANDEYECASGFAVQLLDGSDVLGSAVSDVFGDFKIDGIDCSRPMRKLSLVVTAEQRMVQEIEISESVYLGRIELNRH